MAAPKIFISPAKYVQGADAIGELGKHVYPLGRHALVVGGNNGLQSTRAGRVLSFRENGVTQTEEVFRGESSDAEVTRLVSAAQAANCDVIIACGGGKAIDAVKATAAQLGLPCVVVPTVASNDSPCSSLSVIYNDDGTFNRLQFLGRNPDLVLVDTRIIANAPVRQLVSGMGDALATWYEADASYRSGATNVPGGAITQSALALAQLCRDTLFEFGVGAKLACERHVVTPALERVVEANTLLSGLGFESGSVALAHALSEGFSAIPEAHRHTHGELVAFCLLTQLILEARSHEEFSRVYEFCRAVGLPTTLAQVNAEPGDALRRAAAIAAEPGRPTHNLSFPVSADAIYDAMLAVDAISTL
ncbi:MAG: glycerol dehydrogenase [Oscillospiraceae bacterium]|jgi:glycerol dehydrogenase|nr:glycerol dehydrogenase [Oscillospiraceae bacterium]